MTVDVLYIKALSFKFCLDWTLLNITLFYFKHTTHKSNICPLCQVSCTPPGAGSSTWRRSESSHPVPSTRRSSAGRWWWWSQNGVCKWLGRLHCRMHHRKVLAQQALDKFIKIFLRYLYPAFIVFSTDSLTGDPITTDFGGWNNAIGAAVDLDLQGRTGQVLKDIQHGAGHHPRVPVTGVGHYGRKLLKQ